MILTSICCNSPLFHTHKLRKYHFSLGLFIVSFTLRLNVRQQASCQSYDRDVHDLCGCESLTIVYCVIDIFDHDHVQKKVLNHDRETLFKLNSRSRSRSRIFLNQIHGYDHDHEIFKSNSRSPILHGI